ncbi:MAG TPA: hypothetical protein PKM44_11935 [Turneriella sp.]|nr:hypothetical protein [Turneriella sp.]HNA79278.1 hypothetical protein [Turneriella sp.]HNE20956.1 hypothetical protein [Turneriella sp.]HNJ66511.1 hypothetical protein [Turneriella sp.]HNL11216.1 hypothetical protein [Turneriella sp.]
MATQQPPDSFFNREAFVTAADGTRCALDETDFTELNNRSNYWHSREDPSTWLCVSTVSRARNKFRDKLNRQQTIALCAQTLNITPSKLEHALDWNANYMAWHDGGSVEETHAWLPGSET